MSRIEVNPSRSIGRVDPKIYGHFLSRRRWVADDALYQPGHPEADEAGIRRDVRAALAAAAPPIIRWPGGCTGTTYNWQDGIGPAAQRPRSVDWHFGYDVGNGFGTAEFVSFCRSIGAEPQINLPMGTGTLRDALEWLEYTNGAGPSRWADLRRAHGHPEPFDVRYWQIGNEEWGDWEIGHSTGDEYAVRAREWAKSIKKLDPELQVLALGCWLPDQAVPWTYAVLREAWQYLDYVTAHKYWGCDRTAPDGGYHEMVASGYLEEQAIRAMAGLIDLVAREKGSTKRPRLAFTEWNAGGTQRAMSPTWRGGGTQYRLADALAVAAFLNAMQRQCNTVGLANFAQSINVAGALAVTDEYVIRETVYWPLLLQRQHSGSVAVPVTVDSDGYTLDRDGQQFAVPYLDVSATKDEASRRLWISVINRHRTEEILAELRLPNVPHGLARTWRLWHEDPLGMNTVDDPDAVAPQEEAVDLGSDPKLALPPHSYTILELQF